MASLATSSPTTDGATECPLEARNLSAGYGQIPVIRDVSLTVRRGEVLALLGANGAGKTTTMLALAGELRPMSGSVWLLGEKCTAPLFMRARRGLRFVTEERSVFMGLSAEANLRLAHKDISSCVAMFPELEPLLSRRAGLLSGGEQQMLTLARALTGDPAVVLVDELSMGLAPMVVERLLRSIREAADRGAAVVLVEQQIRHALAVADFGCVMRRGEIVLRGPGEELLRDTASIEAQYLGGG